MEEDDILVSLPVDISEYFMIFDSRLMLIVFWQNPLQSCQNFVDIHHDIDIVFESAPTSLDFPF